VPFADSQGDRLVLGWNATSPQAASAAKRIPSVWEIFKHAKISKLDSYFEILDARFGKSLGGVLIQVGSGPASYDAAFSAGNALFLLKDGKRVSVYSLQDGRLEARLVGGIPPQTRTTISLPWKKDQAASSSTIWKRRQARPNNFFPNPSPTPISPLTATACSF
jgi:hypothetical protein